MSELEIKVQFDALVLKCVKYLLQKLDLSKYSRKMLRAEMEEMFHLSFGKDNWRAKIRRVVLTYIKEKVKEEEEEDSDDAYRLVYVKDEQNKEKEVDWRKESLEIIKKRLHMLIDDEIEKQRRRGRYVWRRQLDLKKLRLKLELEFEVKLSSQEWKEAIKNAIARYVHDKYEGCEKQDHNSVEVKDESKDWKNGKEEKNDTTHENVSNLFDMPLSPYCPYCLSEIKCM